MSGKTRGEYAYAMIALLMMIVASPFVTTSSAAPITFSSGYSSPPDYPVTSNVQISPINPVVGDEVTCSYDFYDQNGDADHSTIYWQLINTTGGYFITNGHSLDTSDIEPNSVIECYVIAYDGNDFGNTDRTQIVIGENASRNLPELVPSIVYIRNNQSSYSYPIYEGQTIEMSHKEQFEWNVTLMKLNLNKDFIIYAYISNDTTGMQSLGSKYITATNQNDTMSFDNLSFEHDDGCYVATILIMQVSKPGVYYDYFDFVIDVGNNGCPPYEERRIYDPDCITCPKIDTADIYTHRNNPQQERLNLKTTGLYPGKEYQLDIVLINENTPAIVFSETDVWNATYGARTLQYTNLNLSVGDYCMIVNMYEDGNWIDTVRTCETVEEPDPPAIHYTVLRYDEYDIEYFVETKAKNLVVGKTYTLDVELVNNTTGYQILRDVDTINAASSSWKNYMDRTTLSEGSYCSNAKLFENGVLIDEETRCTTVENITARIVSNSLSFDKYQMEHKTYTKVSYLTRGENYSLEIRLENNETGNTIVVENHNWTAFYGARTFRIYDINLPIGEFCLTAVLYENGVEIDSNFRCYIYAGTTARIVTNSITYDEYQMEHNAYSRVDYLTHGENYRVEIRLSNNGTGTNILVENHNWVANHGVRAFSVNGIDLPIGEFCFTTVLYENGVEIDRSVSCTNIICQYDTNSLDIGAETEEEQDDDPSFVENIVEAILDVVAQAISEIFAETRTEDTDESSENDSEEITNQETVSTN